MSFVPAICLACARVALVSLTDAARGELACKACTADLRVVPGCSFAAADRDDFAELCEVVAEANTTRSEAQAYATGVQHALWSGNYTSITERLSGRLVGLVPLQTAVGKSSAAQRRMLLMLKTILEALSTARSGSAEYAIFGAPEHARANRG